MENKIIALFLFISIILTIVIGCRLEYKLKDSLEQYDLERKKMSSQCDSIAIANDSLNAIIQEDRITIGRYEYMIELIRENLDSNKVDKVLKNIE